MILSKVVLPEPFGPRSSATSPGSTRKLSPSNNIRTPRWAAKASIVITAPNRPAFVTSFTLSGSIAQPSAFL